MKRISLLPEHCRERYRNVGSTLLLAGGALLLTLGLFAVFYALFAIYPFGEKSIVWCDMEQQAVPLLLQFKQILEQGESPLYHLLNAGGMNFYGVYFFFLSNPFSYLVLLTDIPVSSLMNLIVPMKLALASAAMVIWLRYRHPGLPAASALLPALMYGFCGYGLMFYQNLMWLDVQALAPLLLLSVDLLLHKGKVLPYFCTIGLQIVFCYYIGYMTVVFLLLYVGAYLVCMPREERKALHLPEFWLTSLLAALATAFVWLPSFLQIARSARSGNLIQNLVGNMFFDALPEKFALLAATSIVFAVLPFLWWQRKRLPSHESRRRLILCALLLIGTFVDPINAMWHTGSYQAFPYRWAFWPILLGLTFAAELLMPHEPLPEKKALRLWQKALVIGLPILALTSIAVLPKFYRNDMISYVQTLWLSEKNTLLLLIPTALAVCAYIIIIGSYRRGRITYRAAMLLCTLLFGGEMTLHTYCDLCAAAVEDTLYTQTVSAADRIEDDAFYRVKLTRKYAHANMVGALGYPTMAHYTSLTRADYMEGVKKMGYSSYWMEVPSMGGTVLTDALWGVRYQLGQERDFRDWVETVWTDGLLSIGETSITLPQAIRVEENPHEIAALPDGKRSRVQAYLAKQKLGRSDVITEYPYTKTENVNVTVNDDGGVRCEVVDESAFTTDIRFSLFAEEKQILYFDLYSLTGTEIGNALNESVSISVNGIFLEKNYPQNSNNGLICLGAFDHEYVTVRAVVHESFSCESFGVFGISTAALAEAAETLPRTELLYENGSYSVITKGDSEATLVLAIPYDEGFSATVNGQPAAVYRVNTCEVAVVVPAGEAKVTLDYTPPALRVSLVCAGIGVLLFALYAALRHRFSQALRAGVSRCAVWVTWLAFGAVLLVIYVFPVVVYLGYYTAQGISSLL